VSPNPLKMEMSGLKWEVEAILTTVNTKHLCVELWMTMRVEKQRTVWVDP
jgi:hypothetical protein